MFRPALNDLQSILVIGAHPDDIEIGCGGTLLRLLAGNSVNVHWVVLSGADERRSEALASADYFLQGAASREIQVQSFPDRFFPGSYNELKAFFGELSGRVAPDLVFTHRREDRHQDHSLVADLTWNAFRDHLIFEYEIPKYEGDLGQPNVYVDLEDAYCSAKIDAILEHFVSQRTRQWFDAETFRSLLRIRGVEADSGSRYAEAFYCRKLVL